MKDEEAIKIVADNIRIERLRKRLSQEKLAEMAGVSAKYINMIENCKVNPTIIVIIKICRALTLDLNTIYNVL